MQIPQLVKEEIIKQLDTALQSFEFVSGGCISNGGKLKISKGKFFLKWNDATRFPSMFETEARGLKCLFEAKSITIPGVEIYGTVGEYQFIVMEFIEPAKRAGNFWSLLGERLASLHRNSSNHFGLDHDNYIGSLPQHNRYRNDWIEFFIDERLRVQLELASQNGLTDNTLLRAFDDLFRKLHDLLPIEKPSLLHGDLWSGNLIVDEKGEPCLIDPAVYYGHREIELAFTTLFGGFDPEFYDSYTEAFPLQHGFKQRIDIYNLYPLLVHANLFGASYMHDVKRIVSRYS